MQTNKRLIKKNIQKISVKKINYLQVPEISEKIFSKLPITISKIRQLEIKKTFVRIREMRIL